MLRGKERKERKNRYATLNRGKEDLYTLKKLQGAKNSRKRK